MNHLGGIGYITIVAGLCRAAALGGCPLRPRLLWGPPGVRRGRRTYNGYAPDGIVVLVALLIGASLVFGANLMPNGDFEAAPAEGHIVGWSTVPADAFGPGHQGKHGLLLSQQDATATIAYVSDAVAVPAGTKTLYASGYDTNARNIGGDGSLVISLLFFDAADKALGEAVIEKTKETPNEWRKFRATASLPEGTHHVKVSLKLDHVSGAGGLDELVLDTEDFGQVGSQFPNDRHVFATGEKVSFRLTATKAMAVQVRDYDERNVREIALDAGKPTDVTFEKPEPGIYWITDPGGAYLDVFAVVVPAPKLADSEKSHFGVHYAYMDRDHPFVEATLDVCEKVGAVWLRANTSLSTDPEHPCTTERDYFMDSARKRGLHVLTMFEDYNFPESAKPPWTNPVALTVIANYVKHCQGKLRYFEVWNEANTSDEYFAFHKAFYEAVKKANPDAQVVQTGIASSAYAGQWGTKYTGSEFQRKLLDLGFDQYTDVYNIHFYPWQWRTEDIVGQYIALYRKYGVKKPLWVTENGNVMDLTNFPQQRAAAEYLVKSAVTCLSLGVDKYFWFLAVDHPTWNFGLVADDGRRPKAAVPAYATLAGLLDSTDFIGRPSGGVEAPQAFRFREGGREVIVLWSDAPDRKVDLASLNLAAGAVTVVDMMGRGMPLDPAKPFTVGPRPVYLVGKAK